MSESKYEMIIYWSDEDKAFLVEVPELPGCMADGETRAEAIKNANEVIQLWIETAKSLGWKIPKPRGRLAYA
jgi:predicted RNase H-like HicB family nuclease